MWHSTIKHGGAMRPEPVKDHIHTTCQARNTQEEESLKPQGQPVKRSLSQQLHINQGFMVEWLD